MELDQQALQRLRIGGNSSAPVRSRADWTRNAAWMVAGVLIGAPAGIGAAWLWRPQLFREMHLETPAVASGSVPAGPASTLPTASILSSSGYVVARRKTTVASSVTGRLQKLLVVEGDTVTKGQLLARLEDSAEQARSQSAKSQIKSAESQLRRYELELAQQNSSHRRTLELKAQGMVSTAAVEQSALQLSVSSNQLERGLEDITQSRLNLDLAATALEATFVRAPFSGVVVALNAQVGEVVSPVSGAGGFIRTGICTIVDMNSLMAEVEINEKFLKDIFIGQQLTVVPEAYGDVKIGGTVVEISKQVDRVKGTVLVKAELTGVDNRILPDMAVRAALFRRAPL